MSDSRGRDIKILAVVLAAALILIGTLAMTAAPALQAVAAAFAPGIGLRVAALWGFGVTVGLFVLFAIVAGDGLFGEIQFILASFFGFYVVITLLIAWVF
jgi:hypothetical protein